MKKLIFFGSVLAIVALGAISLAKATEKKEPPPGWTIVCDGAGHFGARFPEGYVIGEDGEKLMTSRQWAIDRAWQQYEYEKSGPSDEPPQNVWHDCEGSDLER